MSWFAISALIISGIFVGFINTLAGGGVAISMAVMMMLGLPANVANASNRVAVICQNITSVREFRKKGLVDFRKGSLLAVPTIIGSIIGAQVAIDINEEIFKKALGVILLMMVGFILVKPSVWLTSSEEYQRKKINPWQYVLFFFIGIYGGFIQIGVGYFLLAGAVLGAGYDLLRANALKIWVVLLYTPFALIVFIFHKVINWEFGLIHAIGNIIGAYLASRFALSWGVGFVRWVIVVVIIVFSIDLLGIVSLKSLFM